MTIIKEKKSFYSTLKFKVMIFFLSVIIFFYFICIFLTTSATTANRLESERILTYRKNPTKNLFSSNSINITFLKNLNSRIEELKLKLQKDTNGNLLLSKAELQDFLNLNPETKIWQKYAEYIANDNDLTMNVFYPVSEIPFLKHLPGISSRTCNLKLIIQPWIKNKTLFVKLKSISLPEWISPLMVSNVSWPIELPGEEWKYLKTIDIYETGVFLQFERKIESGR